MNKFFDYVLLAFCGLFMLTAIIAFIATFLIESLFGLGDPAPMICIASALGGLYNAAVCWALHKVIVHVGNKQSKQ